MAFATERTDWVFPALREAAIMLCRGLSLETWLAQVYANQGDLLKGRQMPSHMSARDVNQVAWSSNIGTQLPHAVGAALAARLRGDAHVVVGFLGDGATSEPDFHAAMTFAGRYKPPVILICQNNHWSISVPTSKQTASRTLAVKALAYGLPAERVDGNDVLGVYSATKRAVDRARNGDGPTFRRVRHVPHRARTARAMTPAFTGATRRSRRGGNATRSSGSSDISNEPGSSMRRREPTCGVSSKPSS